MPQTTVEEKLKILKAISPYLDQSELAELQKDLIKMADEGTSIGRRYAPKRYQVRSEQHPTTGPDPHRYYQKLYPGHPLYSPDDPDFEQEITKEEFDKSAHEREAYKSIKTDYDKRRSALEQKIKDVQERQAKTAPDINAPAKPKPRVYKSQKEYDEYLEAKHPGSKRPQPTTAKSVMAETAKKQIAQRKAKKELRQKSKAEKIAQKKAQKMKKDYSKVFKKSFVTAPDPDPITQTDAMQPLEDPTARTRKELEAKLAEIQKAKPGTEAEILASMTKKEVKAVQSDDDVVQAEDEPRLGERIKEGIEKLIPGEPEPETKAKPTTIEEKNDAILRESIPRFQRLHMKAPTEKQVKRHLESQNWPQSAIDEFIETHRDKLRK